jgi:hypothetical protein
MNDVLRDIHAENKLIYFVCISLGIISMACSLVIIIILICYKRLRNDAMELVFYMTIASLFNNLSYILKYVGDEEEADGQTLRCQTQAFLMVWTELSQMLWAILMSCTVYQKVVVFEISDSNDNLTNQQRFLYISFAYFVPLIISFFFYSFDIYGLSGGWCGIKEKDYGPMCLLILYFIVWICILIVWLYTFLLIRFLCHTYLGANRGIVSRFIYKLLCCWIPGTIYRMYFYFKDDYCFWMRLTALFGFSSQGLVYGLIYGCNPHLRKELKEIFCFGGRTSSNLVEEYGISSENITLNESDRKQQITGESIDNTS